MTTRTFPDYDHDALVNLRVRVENIPMTGLPVDSLHAEMYRMFFPEDAATLGQQSPYDFTSSLEHAILLATRLVPRYAVRHLLGQTTKRAYFLRSDGAAMVERLALHFCVDLFVLMLSEKDEDGIYKSIFDHV